MLGTLLTAALAIGMPQDYDTTFAAGSASSVVIEVWTGEVVVRGWDRNEIRVRADGADGEDLEIERRGDRISIESGHGQFMGGSVSLELDVPARFNVQAEGMTVPVRVEGVSGYVDVENMSGNVTVLDTRGIVQVETMAGAIRVERSRGNLDLNSAGHAVEVVGAAGEIEIETIGGPISLRNVTSSAVQAESLGGRIEFDGILAPGGSYYFSSHGGMIDLALGPGANATFELDTMMGEIEAEYPGLTLESSRRGRMRFVVGSGGAHVEVETFSGRVRVRERGRR